MHLKTKTCVMKPCISQAHSSQCRIYFHLSDSLVSLLNFLKQQQYSDALFRNRWPTFRNYEVCQSFKHNAAKTMATAPPTGADDLNDELKIYNSFTNVVIVFIIIFKIYSNSK